MIRGINRADLVQRAISAQNSKDLSAKQKLSESILLGPDFKDQYDLGKEDPLFEWPQIWNEYLDTTSCDNNPEARKLLTYLAIQDHPILRHIVAHDMENHHSTLDVTFMIGAAILHNYSRLMNFNGLAKLFEEEHRHGILKGKIHEHPQEFNQLHDLLRQVIFYEPMAYIRLYAIMLAADIAAEMRFPFKIEALLKKAMSDPDPLNALRAWKGLDISPEDVCQEPLPIMLSARKFGIERYLSRRSSVMRAWRELAVELENTSYTSTEEVISIQDVRVIHPLDDFNPDASLRKLTMYNKYLELTQLIKEHKTLGRVCRFLFNDTLPVVIKIDDEYLLCDFHHRIAALMEAQKNKIIPDEWGLDSLLFQVRKYNNAIPNELIKRIMTLGHRLTWSDLFPVESDLPTKEASTPLFLSETEKIEMDVEGTVSKEFKNKAKKILIFAKKQAGLNHLDGLVNSLNNLIKVLNDDSAYNLIEKVEALKTKIKQK